VVDADLESMSSSKFSEDMFGEITYDEQKGLYSSSLLEEVKTLGKETYGLSAKDVSDLEYRVQ
jgi:hypothetical protein